VTYQSYVVAIADALTDDHNLHPDDAVELIDMNRGDVVDWYAERARPASVASTLMRRLRRGLVAHPNPMPAGQAAVVLGAIAALSVGVALIAKAVQVAKTPKPEPTPYTGADLPPTLYV
jgi:hypothetical protein